MESEASIDPDEPSDDGISVRAGIDLSVFSRLKVSATVTLTADEWGRYFQHCEKSGSPVARKIAEQVKTVLERVERAKQVLKGSA